MGTRKRLAAPALVVVVLFTAAFPATARDASAEAVARLAAAGIEVGDIVVQRGDRLYAGPSCPGDGWQCTDATIVVQEAHGGAAVFECTGSSSGPNECTVVQTNTGGTNTARCVLGTPASPVTTDPVAQSCTIEQTNTTGGNDAYAEQAVAQSKQGSASVTQDATQSISINQTNESGTNTAVVRQTISQKAVTKNLKSSISQVQEADQDARVEQRSDSGNQDLDVAQSQTARAEAKFNTGGPITQLQNDVENGPDIESFTRQFSNTGFNNERLAQTSTLDQEAKSNSGQAITQRQGAPGGGLRGDIDGDSNAPSSPGSRFAAAQSKTWKQEGVTTATASLDQDDIEICCILGSGKTYDFCDIDQTASLRQQPLGSQSIGQRGRGIARVNCTLDQSATTNGGTSTNTNSGTFVDDSNGCSEAECDLTRTEPPASELHKAGRNESQNQSFGGDEEPNELSALPGDVIEYRLTYHNHGQGPGNVTSVWDEVPQHTTFLSCSGGCTTTGTNPGSTVAWSLGTVEPAGVRTVTFRVRLDLVGYTELFTQVPNVATADTAEEQPVSSNQVTVTVTCVGAVCGV